MNLSIRCHGCNHSFRRTAAQVLADDRCPHCSSRDIDLDESETHTRTAGHGEAGSCEICGQAIRPGPVKGTFVHYDSMMELAHSAEANAATLSWYGENAPEYLTAALTEPNDAPGTQTCPGCGTANYDGSTCSNCGYTPEDYTKDSSLRGRAKSATRKTAQWFDDRATKQWYQQGTASQGPIFTYAAKVNAIAADVLASNPGMESKTAQAIAQETMRRYPVIAKRR